MFDDNFTGRTVTFVRFGIGCACPRVHFCGHCMSAGRGRIAVSEDNPRCRNCGEVTAKDVVTVYPEGHTHA